MSYRIGEVAKRVGMTVEGLRFYERRGLIAPAARSASRYRLYGETEVRVLRFIKAAQEMGFSLREVEELLSIWRGRDDSCDRMRDRLTTKLETVRRKIDLLRQLESGLVAGVRRCDEHISRGELNECPVLDDWGSGSASRTHADADEDDSDDI